MQLLLPILLLGLLTACATEPTVTEQPSGEFAEEGLYEVSGSGFATAYARRDVRLADYRKVNIELLQAADADMSRTPVGGTLRRDWQMTPEREAALQGLWSESMERSFSAYGRADSGEGVLRIAAAMTRVAPGRPTATTVGGGFQAQGSSQDVVEIFMEFRLYDQASWDLLAVIRDSRTMVSMAMSRTAPAGVRTMFNSWAALLHTRVSGN